MAWARTCARLVGVACIVALAAISIPLFHPDDAYYAKAAKIVLDSGEWMTLYHPLHGLFQKPPLTIWLMAISMHIAGPALGARLWHVLVHLGLAYAVYRLARLSASRGEGLLASLLWLTFALAFYASLLPQQDIPLALFLTLAFTAYVLYRRDGRTGSAIQTGLWLALAALTKGVTGLGVFALVVSVDLLIARRHDAGRQWRWPQVGLGALVFLAVGAPWFVVGAIRHGRPFIDAFILQGAAGVGVGRLLRPSPWEAVPPWRAALTYVPILVAGMLPWTGWLPEVVRTAWRSLRAGPPALRLCALWAGLYFVTLSTLPLGGRWERYLVVAFPALAVLTARAMAGAIDDPRRLRTAGIVSLTVALPVVVVFGIQQAGTLPREPRDFLALVVPWVTVLGLALIAFAASALRGRGRQAVAITAAAALLAYGLLDWAMATYWPRLWPWPAIAAEVHRLYRPGDRLAVVDDLSGVSNYAILYFEGPVTEILDEAAFARAWTGQRIFGLLSPFAYARLRDSLRPTVLMQTPLGWVLVTNR